MFSKFMKDLKNAMLDEKPRYDRKFREIVIKVQVKQKEEKERMKKVKVPKVRVEPVKPRSKFDSSDEEENYGDINEFGNYSMVKNEEKCAGKWSTKDIHDVKFNEDKLQMQFRSGRLGIFGFAINRYCNLPFQSWEMKPNTKRCEKLQFYHLCVYEMEIY